MLFRSGGGVHGAGRLPLPHVPAAAGPPGLLRVRDGGAPGADGAGPGAELPVLGADGGPARHPPVPRDRRGGGLARRPHAGPIKKVSDDGSALPGAKFDIIRDRSGQVVAQVVTNDQGIAEVNNLLKDDYTIRETEAPAGYELADDVKVSPDDFDSTLKIASKTIVDRKQSSASAQLMAQKVMTL